MGALVTIYFRHHSPERRLLDSIMGSLTPDAVNAIRSIAKTVFNNFGVSQSALSSSGIVHRLSLFIRLVASYRGF